ncbi:MAG: hypothetical protein KF778_05670 [Rhodocyclaceae bacterium]|nr:hypothetical protein [Rhodocyclaceae bacterium]MBX3667872.1 hypothetical protein [Rhodocyclaceae bacterium]
MSDTYQSALQEQLKKNLLDRVREAAANMSPLEQAGLFADVAGIVDPTPVSDVAGAAIAIAQGDFVGAALSGVSLIPYAGDALAKPAKLARRAPGVAKAVEMLLKHGDDIAAASKDALKAAGLSLDQVAAARKKALDVVQDAMLEAKKGLPDCVPCQKLRDKAGKKSTLQMPQNSANGKWAGGVQPTDGNGKYVFAEPKTLPDGRTVNEIDFRKGSPDLDDYVVGGRHELWEVSGNVRTDEKRLAEMMKQRDPHWQPPDRELYTLHHFEDGSVGYVPDVLHDKTIGGIAHTGGNSMINNELF